MKRVLAILRQSLALEREAAKVPPRRAEERAFLPAVLEVTETPPSPTARVLIWSLALFLTLAITWSWFGRVDVVASAEGQTIPSGRSKVVQPLETGIVTAIHVRDGSRVREGDTLIELDTTIAAAERERARYELLAAQLTAARVRALLTTLDEADEGRVIAAFVPPTGADAARVAAQRSLLLAEREEQRAKQASIAEEITRRQAERVTLEASIRRLDDTIPLIAARAEARGELARTGTGSRLIYLEAQQLLVETQHDRRIQGHRLAETDASVATLRAQLRSQIAEFIRTRSAELTEAERQAASFAQEFAKAEQRTVQHRLTAPIDGTIQQLAIHTVGGVVQPAQQLLVVAPAEDRVELEAMVLNRDIGFVRPGQRAEVKLETFNFTRFGLVPGEVISVSGDAIQDEKRGPVYAARIRLLQDHLTVDGRQAPITPGMAASAEIHTGQRRVLDYLLSPIAKYQHEALRER
jgi:hemolysin D